MTAGNIIAAAFRFAGTRFARITGLAWLPIALYGAVWIYAGSGILGSLARIAGRSANIYGFDHLTILAVLGLGWFAVSVAALSSTKLALGIEQRLYLAHCIAGGSEVRLVLACTQLLLLVLGIAVAIVAAVFFGAMALRTFGNIGYPIGLDGIPLIFGPGAPALVRLGMIAAITGTTIFTWSRLGVMLPALAAAGEDVSLRRAWTLGKGHSKHLLTVFLISAVPAGLLWLLTVIFAFGSDMSTLSAALFAPGQADRKYEILSAILVRRSALVVIATGMFLLVATALFSGASAYVYRQILALPAPAVTPRKQAEIRQTIAVPAAAPAQPGMVVYHSAEITPEPTPEQTAEDLKRILQHGLASEPQAPELPPVISGPPAPEPRKQTQAPVATAPVPSAAS